MAAAVGGVDELIREYLLFRGFIQTMRALEQEKKDDKDKGLRVNKIVDHILTCVHKSDFVALQTFWSHLSKRFFSRLNHDLANTAHKLESTILRLFLINAYRNGRHDDIKSFFEKMGGILQDRRDWKEWFTLLYIKNPEQHSTFKIFYSKDWYDAFVVSLYNFFSIMFAGLPLPTLLQFEAEHHRISTLVTEKDLLHSQLATTKEALMEAEANIQKLEARLAQNLAQQSEKSIGKGLGRQGGVRGTQRKTSAKGLESKSKTTPSYYSPPEELVMEKEMPESTEETSPSHPSNKGTITVTTTATTPPPPPATAAVDTVSKEDNFYDETTLAAARAINDVSKPQPFLVVEQHVYKDHSAPVVQCQFSPHALHVASIDTENSLRVWDPTSVSLHTKSSAKYKMELISMDWVHHGSSDNLIMLGFSKSQIRLFDVASSLSLWEFSVDKSFPRVLSIACSSTTPKFAVSASSWLAQQKETSYRVTSSLTSPNLPSQLYKPNEMGTVSRRPTESLSPFDPTPGELSIWDLNQQKIQSVLPLNPPIAVNCMSFNHNSNLLVTGGVDGMIRLFDVTQGECLCGWTAHHGEVYNVQFSSDELSIYSLGHDNKFCQWSTLRSTEKLAQYDIHDNASYPVRGWEGYFPHTPPGNLFAFESEDKYVLTCASDRSILYQV
jgi:WD40 repeat protein